tara:strand:- start:146 stop:433 length:288 start_codon:yes stop_codon:yes gene_type:complete
MVLYEANLSKGEETRRYSEKDPYECVKKISSAMKEGFELTSIVELTPREGSGLGQEISHIELLRKSIKTFPEDKELVIDRLMEETRQAMEKGELK